jgi:hypothetical protein
MGFMEHAVTTRTVPAAMRDVACAVAIGSLAVVTLAQPTGSPDTAYINATVITMNRAAPGAQAVAVKGDTIVAVGSTAAIRRAAGRSTRIVDLAGRVIVPGFVDAHSHFPSAGVNALYVVDLQSPPVGTTTTMDDLIRALRQRAGQTPAGQWVRGAGYDQTLLRERRHPTRDDLDKASTSHPIYIVHTSGHLAVANSRALELAAVTRSTPQPPGGVIQKDAKTGEPNGVFEESGQLIARLIPPCMPEQGREAVRWSLRAYASAGVTTITIAGGGIPEAVQQAAQRNEMTLRLGAMGSWDAALPASRLTESGMVKSGQTIKMVHDGSIQGYTGYLAEPYHVAYHGDASYRGYPRQSRAELFERVKALNRLGYQIAIHANGDDAIADVLAAYRAALEDHPRTDARFRVEHAQMTRDDQLDAMKALGVSPSFFVSHTYFWGDQHRDTFMGPERARRISPLRSAIRRGVRFSIHLDTPVTPMSPLQAVWSAVNRLTRSSQVLGPDERITPEEALRAVTIDAAWQLRDERVKGSIEVGKLADLVVLAESPLAVDPARIKDIQVLETIVGGRTVYSR